MLPSCFEGRSGRVVEKINTAVYQVISFHFIELTVKNLNMFSMLKYVEGAKPGKAVKRKLSNDEKAEQSKKR